jgi:hypothetical protein
MPSTPQTGGRDINDSITTFATQFNRFAPFGYRKFVAVGNRATAIRLHDGRVLLLNPIQLEPRVRAKLQQLGGVHYIACDLGHHMYVADYIKTWPDAKTIGVVGLPQKRKDVHWDFVYTSQSTTPEAHFSFNDDIETVLFEGFITYAVAWYHRPSKTLIVSDLLMNLPAKEQYGPGTSADQGLFSREFAKRAHPRAIFFRRLLYYVACVDFALMRRDTKRVAEWDMQRIIPCHGEIIESDADEAWREVYQWFLQGNAKPGLLWRFKEPFMKAMRWMFLL